MHGTGIDRAAASVAQDMERVRRIVEIANRSEGPLQNVDEVEELLLKEMRRLGNATINEWDVQSQERVGQELKTQNPDVLKRKNISVAVRFWTGRGAGTNLEQCRQKLPAPFASTSGRESERQIPPVATGAHRLWL